MGIDGIGRCKVRRCVDVKQTDAEKGQVATKPLKWAGVAKSPMTLNRIPLTRLASAATDSELFVAQDDVIRRFKISAQQIANCPNSPIHVTLLQH